MKQITFIVVILLLAVITNGQERKHKHSIELPCPVCSASGKVERARIAPPADFLLKSGASAKSNIEVTYIGFSDEAKAAFAYAVSIWESLIESEIPIRIKAEWKTLGTNVLGSCGPETYYANFVDAPFEDRYYAVAIAEKIAKEELNGESRYDMNANFNKNIDWYLGTDLNCPDDKYDLVSVVLHEIAHGLGFTGFFFVDDDLGGYGFYEMGDASSYDLLVQNSRNQTLVDPDLFENTSGDLFDALTGGIMFAKSPVAKKNNGDSKARLYAPATFNDGSSVYHLNDANYPHGNENSLMTHAVGKAEAIHDPGPLTLGIMDDIGWKNLFIRFNQVKDQEQFHPLTFNTTFESDYGIDTSAIYIIYSNDNFESHSDSLSLKFSEETGKYTATLVPGNSVGEITYYVEAADTMGRVRTKPSTVPGEYYSIKFGPDNEKPVIEHEPLPYFVLLEDPISLTVDVNDNLGIDTVYVQFSINGEQQGTFGLGHYWEDNYKGEFPVDLSSLSDGDKIEYRIMAIDASVAKNSTQLPLGDEQFSFKVESIFEPLSTYETNFNDKTSDFVISDFGVYTANNFENGALHSPHPYLSPKEDNKDLDFYTFLKYPIVVRDSGVMTFDEVVLVEPAEEFSEYGDADFWDYVIIEASKNYGETWLPLTKGYDATSQTLWEEAYKSKIIEQESFAKGTSDMFFSREVVLTENGNFSEGDTILIRFRLYSDPYANGWGWAIDNLQIQRTVSADPLVLKSYDIKVYPNPFKDELKLSFDLGPKLTTLQLDVYDLYGKKVHSELKENVSGKWYEKIDLNHLSNGMFLIQISEKGIPIISKKLIKN